MSDKDSQPAQRNSALHQSIQTPGAVLAQVQEPLRKSLLTQLIQLEIEQVNVQSGNLASRLKVIHGLKVYYLEQCPEFQEHVLREFSRAEKELGDLISETNTKSTSEESVHARTAEETYFDTPPDQNEAESPNEQFKILRSHAKGGLGEVFVALDQDLNREVALKEIKSKFSDDQESRERFVREAEITGGLEHPGIVPVYASGHFADGRPFYVMRFIRGESLQNAVEALHDESSTNVRQKILLRLLRRLVDACNAIAYAHSRGIIHRDIKPSNIMLGKHGETLVVDWGVARAVGRQEESSENLDEQTIRPGTGDASSTVVGSAIGTPAYMSPEQAKGDLDAMGPASDVYSLGATLYCILCNTAPFTRGKLDSILKQVQEGDFRAPSDVTPHVPPALEAICLRAMATEMDDRYGSALALADDIENFLTDMPVTCYRDPWLTRLTRTIRQNQAMSAFVAALVIAALVGLGLFSNLERAQNVKLAQLNKDLRVERQTALKNAAEAQRQFEVARAHESEALRQSQVALANETEAKRQSEVALGILNYVVTEVQEQLSSRPGVGDLRRDILQKAVDQLDEISSEFVDSTVVDRNLMTVFSSLGRLSIRFDFGNIEDADDETNSQSSAKSGDSGYQQGLRLLLKANHIAERLHKQLPDDKDIEAKFLENLLDIAKAHRFAGSKDSSQEFLSVKDQAAALAKKHPSDMHIRVLLSHALAFTSYSLAYSEQFDDAERLSLQGLKVCDAVLASEIDEQQRIECTQYKALLFRVRGNLAVQVENDQELAESRFMESLRIIEELAEQRQTDWQIQHELQIALSRVCKTLTKQSKYQQAKVHYDRLLSLATESYEMDPQDVSMRNNLALTEFNLGELLLQIGKFEESEIHLANSRKHFRSLLDEGYSFERSFANSHLQSARLAMRVNDLTKAEEFFQLALEVRRKYAQDNSSRSLRELSVLLDSMANLYLRLDNVDQANSLAAESIASSEAALKKDPSNALVRQKLANSLSVQANLYLHQDQNELAIKTFEQELELRRNLSLETTPSKIDQERRLVAQKKLAQLLVEANELEKARSLLDNSIRLHEEDENANLEDLEKKLEIYEDLASIAEKQKDTVCRLQYLRTALDLSQEIHSGDPLQARDSIPKRMEIHTVLREMSAHSEAAEMIEVARQEAGVLLESVRMEFAKYEDLVPIDVLKSKQTALGLACKVYRTLHNQKSFASNSIDQQLASLETRLGLEEELTSTIAAIHIRLSDHEDESESKPLSPMRLPEFEARNLVAEQLLASGKRPEALELLLTNSVAAYKMDDKPLHLSKMAPRIRQFADLLTDTSDKDSGSPRTLVSQIRLLAQAAKIVERNNRFKRLAPDDAVDERVLEGWREKAKELLEILAGDQNWNRQSLSEYPELKGILE